MIELYTTFVQPILIILFIGIIIYLHFRFKSIEVITKYLLKKGEDKKEEDKNEKQ